MRASWNRNLTALALSVVGVLPLSAMADPAVVTAGSASELAMQLGGASLATETFEDAVADGVTIVPATVSRHLVGWSSQNFVFEGIYSPAFIQGTGGQGSSQGFLDSVSSSAQWETVWKFDAPRHGVGGEWDLTPWGFGEGIKVFAVFASGEKEVLDVSKSSLGDSGRGFLGFSANESFSALILRGAHGGQGSAETYVVDNIVFGTQLPPVPEPATALLFGAGLAGLGTVRRRKAGSPR